MWSYLNRSKNKKDYVIEQPAYMLSRRELRSIVDVYSKKGIKIYVQSESYIGEGLREMKCIQQNLTHDEYVGYLYTNYTGECDDDIRGHVECFVINKTQIIKPVRWHVFGRGAIELKNIECTTSTDLTYFGGSGLIPQATGQECASLSIGYLKKMLKDNAKQVREFSLSIPYFSADNRNKRTVNYFFFPPPQVLAYSQIAFYNEYLAGMLESTASNLMHNEPAVTLQDALNQTIQIAHQLCLSDVEQEAKIVLQRLPEFRKKWLHAYEEVRLKREQMQRQTKNYMLTYTTHRFKKIVLAKQAERSNLGLSLFTKIRQKKAFGCSETRLVKKRDIQDIVFRTPDELGYFLNKIGNVISVEIIYAQLMAITHVRTILSDPRRFMHCVFWLSPDQRRWLVDYFKNPVQFQAMFNSDRPFKIDDVLFWLCVLHIPEHEKTSFLQARLPTQTLAAKLQTYLMSTSLSGWNTYFKDRKELSKFLTEYVDTNDVIQMLPLLFKSRSLNNLMPMFECQEAYTAFIHRYLPMTEIRDLLVVLQRPSSDICFIFSDYLSCYDMSQSSEIVSEELCHPSTMLFQLLTKDDDPRWMLELLSDFCHPTDIISILSTHQIFLLKSIAAKKSIYPMNMPGSLRDAVQKYHLFDVTDPEIIQLYRDAFGALQDEQDIGFLYDILNMLPVNKRRMFVERIYSSPEDPMRVHIDGLQNIQDLLIAHKPNLYTWLWYIIGAVLQRIITSCSPRLLQNRSVLFQSVLEYKAEDKPKSFSMSPP